MMDFHIQLLFGSMYVVVAGLFVIVMYMAWDTMDIPQKLARRAARKEAVHQDKLVPVLVNQVSLNASEYDALPDDEARQEALIRYAVALQVSAEKVRKVFTRVNEQHLLNQYNAAFNTSYSTIAAYHFISFNELIARSFESEKGKIYA